MSLPALALDWSLDGSAGIAFLIVTAAAACVYVSAAVIGSRRDRRHRPWPRQRMTCFLAGLGVLVLDLYSGIGTGADRRLAVHMVEHMVMWLLVAPLLAAGAPIRLALFALGRNGRRRLAGWLHSRPLTALTSPLGSASLFAVVLLATHFPAVYGLALRDETAHEAEHALYLVAALLMWAPLLGVDPLPHRLSARARLVCLAACMLPMLALGAWLGLASGVVYPHYVAGVGPAHPAALHDQRVAATIMWAGGLPAFLIPGALRRTSLPRRRSWAWWRRLAQTAT